MQRRKIENIDRDKFGEKMHSESDRACAILGAAFLDAKLENLFAQRFKKKYHIDLLNGTSSLSTFPARIRLASALAWIDDPIQIDLDIIRKIRNDFAHSFDHELSFQNPSLVNRCGNLLVAQSYIEGYTDSIGAPDQNLSEYAIRSIKEKFQAPRWRFQLSVDFIAQYFDDIPVDQFEYEGPSLLQEVRDLSANSRGKVSGAAAVSSVK